MEPALPDVRIVASGGFTAQRIRDFEAHGVPVDAYGVGSSLIRGQNDFTADVVQLEGRPCAKVGTQLCAQSAPGKGSVIGRLEPMKHWCPCSVLP